MLTGNDKESVGGAPATLASGQRVAAKTGIASDTVQTRLERVLSIEWLGQTAASICWIASVLSYGISSSGDWLQLLAASSWLLANTAAIVTLKADYDPAGALDNGHDAHPHSR